MGIYHTISELSGYQIWDGAVARAIHGERLTVGIIDLDANVLVPEHRHENEQLGFVLRGEITMVIGGDARRLKPGDMYTIPSGVMHSAALGPDGATVVDVFAPVRADWEASPRLPASPGRWPA